MVKAKRKQLSINLSKEMYIEPPDYILHTIKDSSADQEIEDHAQLLYPRIIRKRQQIKHLNKYTKIMVS